MKPNHPPRLLIALAASLMLTACASSKKLPSEITSDSAPPAVKQAFASAFPAATEVEWKLKSDKNYEAEFTQGGTEISAKFDPAGKWVETESAIPGSQLPQAVSDAIAAQFAGYKVIETQVVRRPGERWAIYELHLENGEQVVKAQLAADGAVLNQSAKPRTQKAK